MSTHTPAYKNFSQLLPRFNHTTVVRRLELGDLESLSAYRADPDLARYQEWEPMTRAETRDYLLKASGAEQFMDRRWVQLGIAKHPSDILIGDLGICLRSVADEAEIGFTLCREAQGQGHAQRAVRLTCNLVFESTGVATVRAVTDTRNQPSIRLLEATGFSKLDEIESVFKQEVCREAVYILPRDPAACD